MELVRLYSNLSDEHRLLCDVAAAASTTRRARSAQQRPRQRQYRLNQAQVAELIAAYRQQKSIKELARRYDVHRSTVSALLDRHNARQSCR